MAHLRIGHGGARWRAIDLEAISRNARVSAAQLAQWFAARLLAERERWFLWLPVALAAGIGLYFALPGEPPRWLGPAAVLALAPIVLQLRLRARDGPPRASLPWLVGALAIGLGFTVAQLRAVTVEAPMLARQGVFEVEGRVALVEDRVSGHRIVVDRPLLDGVRDERTPARVRISLRTGGEAIRAGDRVGLLAMLMPASAPTMPGGFDFARQAYFERLGAVGFAYGAPRQIEPGRPGDYGLWLARLRQTVASEITSAVPGTTGAVATALLTGLRAAIPEEVWRNMQTAGLAHLLAISGLHLGLVAGTLFLAVRYGLLLTPHVGFRWPVKKIAAAVALAGAFGYMQLTGAPIPTQRAFFMAGMVLVAIMADRNPLSMRLVAWAALIVLLITPESLLGASFQMSFAAVVALIAVYETGRATLRSPGEAGLGYKLMLYVLGVAVTTVVASTATAPLAGFHFQRIATFGIVANLIAVPVTAFWIMPAGLLGLLLIPLGLSAPPFVLMGHGIDVVLWTAASAAAMPMAALDVAQWPTSALVAFALGGLWLCLWQQPWRWLGLAGLAAGLLLALAARPPDVLIAADGELVAVRQADGRLAISPWRRDSYTTSDWLRRSGHREPAPWPEVGLGGDWLACDGIGCTVRANGHALAIARRPEALSDDCARADLVVSFVPITGCAERAHVLSPGQLIRSRGLAVWLEPGGLRILSVRESRGERPWTR